MNCAIHTEAPATAFCRTCGKALCEICRREVVGITYCEPCIARRMQSTMPAAAPGVTVMRPMDVPNPGLALGLGFIPGVGAMYNGQVIKGFVHVGIFATLIAVTDHAGFFGIFIPFFIFYMVIDAYQTAHARERNEPLPDYLGLNNLIGSDFGTRPVSRVMPPVSGFQPTTSGFETTSPGYQAQGPQSPQGFAGSAGEAGAERPPVEAAGGAQTNQFVSPAQFPVGAVVLIAVGGLFLMDTLGLASFHWIEKLWPLILIAVGVSIFMRRNQYRR